MLSFVVRIALAACVALGLATGATLADGAKHKLAIQVSENIPAAMTLALNNAQNVINYYKKKNETVDVQIVTFSAGLHMLRADTSPVKDRIAAMSLAHPNLHFAACENTRENMSKAENKEIVIIAEGTKVPSGVVTLMELQSKGYSYIRP